MAYTSVATVVTGQAYLASDYNTYIRDNMAALWPYTTAGDIVYATSSSTLARLSIGTNGQVLTVTSGAPAWGQGLPAIGAEGQVLTVSSGAPAWGQGFPAGVIFDYAGSSVPTGWLDCNGAAVSRTTYSALYSAIGTTFGSGDGLTTFNLPDFRGRASIGVGTGTGLTARARGATTGTETHTLTGIQIPGHQHYIKRKGISYQGGTNNVKVLDTDNPSPTEYAVTENSGGNESHPNMQPSLAVYKIIKT